jgi:hypothetical protein
LKGVNDTHGHPAGDRVLKQVVERVTSALRPSDLLARMGGSSRRSWKPRSSGPTLRSTRPRGLVATA